MTKKSLQKHAELLQATTTTTTTHGGNLSPQQQNEQAVLVTMETKHVIK